MDILSIISEKSKELYKKGYSVKVENPFFSNEKGIDDIYIVIKNKKIPELTIKRLIVLSDTIKCNNIPGYIGSVFDMAIKEFEDAIKDYELKKYSTIADKTDRALYFLAKQTASNVFKCAECPASDYCDAYSSPSCVATIYDWAKNMVNVKENKQ